MARRLVLGSEQLARVEAALYEEDEGARGAALAGLKAPEELHAYASHYNWDDGARGLRHVIESSACDRGTALMIYWLTDGIFADERPDCGGDVWDLAMRIESLFLSGFYTRCEFRFDPRDMGGDWRFILQKPRAVPDEMTRATPGEVVDVSWDALRDEARGPSGE